ncbi:MAG: DUF4442 domain-containing protein [Bradymonadaceae bacterium]|nr:DUF4442 domain-containing protein [Lujinxingiaceae bacterium]
MSTTPLYSVAESPLGLRAAAFRRVLTTGPLFKGMLAVRMPLLALAGARIERLDLDRCEVRLPHGWRSQNIFGSTYFAATLMAAEAACGTIVLLHEQNSPHKFGPIVKSIKADFTRAAYSDIVFRCTQGDAVAEWLERAHDSRERVETTLDVVGSTEEGEVARVSVTWSARLKI